MPDSTDRLTTQQFKIDISVSERQVTLSGRMEKGELLEKNLMAVAEAMQMHGGRWVVNAATVHPAPGGIDAWVAIANTRLTSCELFYPESQLAMILQFDDRYTHPHSVYEHQFC